MGLTSKQERFASLVAEGESLAGAYRGAYNAENMKAAVIRNEASKLMANHDIAVMVERIRAKREQSITAAQVSDRDKVLNKLRKMMDGAEAEAVQLQATVWLGKSTAAFSDVVLNEQPVQSADEIRAEIEQRIAELEDETKH